MTRHTNTILFSLPGYNLYRGKVIVDNNSLQKPEIIGTDFDSYFGYAMTSTYLVNRRNVSTLMYIIAAPRAKFYQGEVVACAWQYSKIVYRFTGSQIGEYFGYAVAADDFNGDGFGDVVISAPYYKVKGFNEGVVYVFEYGGREKSDFPFSLRKLMVAREMPESAQFGMAVSVLGDINQDGFNGKLIFFFEFVFEKN